MKIAVAMSGGVDSSVAAALLKKEGHDVIGLTMLVTPSEEAAVAAREVTQMLGIPHYLFDFEDVFTKQVISVFCHEYSLGRTPNPCINCNKLMKFGVLFDKAWDLGAEKIATGHYARLENGPSCNRIQLNKGIDHKRDQSYFLYKLNQEQLAGSLFPLGDLTKDKVREMAAEMELPVTKRKESREICFIPDNDYPSFVRKHLTAEYKSGLIVDTKGNILGKHNGVINYTIGQRKGLGVSSREPLYVVDIDNSNNTVIVGGKQEIYADEFVVKDLNWIAIEKIIDPMTVKTKIRYLHPEAESVITKLKDSTVHVKFSKPQMAITPGQAAVFYIGDTVVGGGTIDRVLH
jgi:tRNA-specific 2-thiouridylase